MRLGFVLRKNNWSWPDKKPIGFPFDCKFASPQQDPVFAFLDPLSNVAWRDITIVNSAAIDDRPAHNRPSLEKLNVP
jgi:hypothetical protein